MEQVSPFAKLKITSSEILTTKSIATKLYFQGCSSCCSSHPFKPKYDCLAL